MACTECGATLAYNVYTGRYFAIAYVTPLTLSSPCMSHGHTPGV